MYTLTPLPDLIAAIASIAAVMIGYDSAFIGTTISLSSFKSEFGFGKMTTKETDLISANIVSCYQAGCFFGALVSQKKIPFPASISTLLRSVFAHPFPRPQLGYVVGQLLGRKWGLLASSMLFTLGAGLMLGATGERGLGLIYVSSESENLSLFIRSGWVFVAHLLARFALFRYM